MVQFLVMSGCFFSVSQLLYLYSEPSNHRQGPSLKEELISSLCYIVIMLSGDKVLSLNGSIFGKRALLAIDHSHYVGFILELCSKYEIIS